MPDTSKDKWTRNDTFLLFYAVFLFLGTSCITAAPFLIALQCFGVGAEDSSWGGALMLGVGFLLLTGITKVVGDEFQS